MRVESKLMKIQRSISFLLMAASVICFVVAYESYNRQVRIAEGFSEHIKGMDFEARIPMSSYVSGLLGVMLLVAGATCYFEYRKQLTGGDDQRMLK